MTRKSKGYLAAGLGASCCVLPLVLLAVGLGGSVLTVFLVKYKTYLMTLAVGVLVYSWFQYTRDAKQCSDQVCEIAGGRLRRWMLGVNTAVVSFFLVITYTPLGSLVGVDYKSEGAVTAEAGTQSAAGRIASNTPGMNPAQPSPGASRMERLALRVEGMT